MPVTSDQYWSFTRGLNQQVRDFLYWICAPNIISCKFIVLATSYLKRRPNETCNISVTGVGGRRVSGDGLSLNCRCRNGCGIESKYVEMKGKPMQNLGTINPTNKLRSRLNNTRRSSPFAQRRLSNATIKSLPLKSNCNQIWIHMTPKQPLQVLESSLVAPGRITINEDTVI